MAGFGMIKQIKKLLEKEIRNHQKWVKIKIKLEKM